ncbi:protein distal antenna-like [Frankliniella occidentalis]|uniref:Protein distal antenna-like n=1 Tax=Frankliniella occidentalis TaxID=133901 RepID=A0A6J1S9I7_FRAOC|nr:protein distal antenna-like [Frankliniella occidentalis]
MNAVANFAKLATAPPPSSKRPVRQSLLSVREKIDAIDRVHEGESKAAVARDIGVPESTLRGWCKTEDKLRSLARACEGSDTPPSDLDKAGLDQDPYSPEPLAKRFRVESENKPAEAVVDDALLYWLKQQQQHVGLAMNEHLLDAKMASDGVVGADNSSWFWRWYKQYGVQTQPLPLAERAERSVDMDRERELRERELREQELRERTAADLSATITPPSPPSQDYLDRDYDAPLSLVKPRERDSDKERENDNLNHNHNHLNHNSVHHEHLSHLSHHVKDHLDNNNVTDLRKQPLPQHQQTLQALQAHHRVVESEDEDDEPPETAAEAVKHGERFLRWLECCSDPSVTALQILQFRYLLNNVRACADRRSRQGKSKDRERSRRK